MRWTHYLTDGFPEQDLPGQCPECQEDMYFNTPPTKPIGWGSYPLGGHRNKMKPNQTLCLVFECPKCFTKSVCHSAEKDVLDLNNEYYREELDRRIPRMWVVKKD